MASVLTDLPGDIAAELTFLRQQASYWKEMHERSLARIEALKREYAEKAACLRERLRACASSTLSYRRW